MTGGRIDPRLIADIRSRISLPDLIGRQIVLKSRNGGREYSGICPFHSEKTPSFYIVEAKGFWHCFGCNQHGDAITWVERTREASFPEAVEYLASLCGLRADRVPEPAAKVIQPKPAAELAGKDRAKKIAYARQTWGFGRTIEGTVGARYLREIRNIRVPLPPTLRLLPTAEHPFARHGWRAPAMMAPIQGQDGDNPRAIVGLHLTYLTSDGRGKARPPTGWPDGEPWKTKIMRGVLRGGAVRLTAAEDVMVIAEGIETALSVMQALYSTDDRCCQIEGEPVGVWAALSLSNMGAIALPSGVREVILAADGDGRIPGAAEAARQDADAIIDAAAGRLADQGRQVRVAWSPAGVDFNDLLTAGGGIGEAV